MYIYRYFVFAREWPQFEAVYKMKVQRTTMVSHTARRQTEADPVTSRKHNPAQRAGRCEDTAATDAGSLKSDIALTCAVLTASNQCLGIGLDLGIHRGLGRGSGIGQ